MLQDRNATVQGQKHDANECEIGVLAALVERLYIILLVVASEAVGNELARLEPKQFGTKEGLLVQLLKA
jgi:hypothetical protein